MSSTIQFSADVVYQECEKVLVYMLDSIENKCKEEEERLNRWIEEKMSYYNDKWYRRFFGFFRFSKIKSIEEAEELLRYHPVRLSCFSRISRISSKKYYVNKRIRQIMEGAGLAREKGTGTMYLDENDYRFINCSQKAVIEFMGELE